jgi:hypothetical protein
MHPFTNTISRGMLVTRTQLFRMEEKDEAELLLGWVLIRWSPAALAKALSNMPCMTRLTVGDRTPDLGPCVRSVDVFSVIAAHAALRTISLCALPLSLDDALALAPFLATRAVVVGFHCCRAGPAALQTMFTAMTQSPVLEVLVISAPEDMPGVMEHTCQIVADSASLRAISVVDCTADFAALAAAIVASPVLTKVCLSSCNGAAIPEMAAVLCHNQTITQLDMIACSGDPAFAVHLADALAVNTGLRELDVSVNRPFPYSTDTWWLDDVGVGAVCRALRHNRTLKHVTFCDDDVELALDIPGMVFALPGGNTTLLSLDFGGQRNTGSCNDTLRRNKRLATHAAKFLVITATFARRRRAGATKPVLPPEVMDMVRNSMVYLCSR